MNPLRFGIMGTAGIARKNWKAIQHSGNCTLTAVASRTAAKSAQFVAEMQAEAPFPVPPIALGSYEELIESSAVDAIYFPLPTAVRKKWVLRAAAVGKHVVCEKPCAVNAGELAEILAVCRHHRVQFLDGVMFMHGARLARLRAILDDGESVGKIRRITSQFSFLGTEGFWDRNIRVSAALEPAGCLGDLGWYNIRFALWVQHWRLPEVVTGSLLAATSEGVPLDFSGELQFADGVSSGFYCSFETFRQQWAHVSGSKGYLQVEDFVNPFSGEETGFTVTQIGQEGHRSFPQVRRVIVPGYASNHPTSPEANLFRHFSEAVKAGRWNEEWMEWTWKTQVVMDALLVSARAGGAKVRLDANVYSAGSGHGL